MALAECLLYEGRSLESARGPQSFRTIPSRQLLTGEPCAGEPHARFGGRGVRLNRTSLPLCAPVRALDQEGESPSMSCLNLLADSNCVTARWGGEQLEANDQSVG